MVEERLYIVTYDISDDKRWRRVMQRHGTEAVAFCRKATELMRAAKLIEPNQIIRLPSEAEWEHAARAGSTTKYSFGDASNRLGEYAWFTLNAAGNDPPVGAKKPNAWGLYDVHGKYYFNRDFGVQLGVVDTTKDGGKAKFDGFLLYNLTPSNTERMLMKIRSICRSALPGATTVLLPSTNSTPSWPARNTSFPALTAIAYGRFSALNGSGLWNCFAMAPFDFTFPICCRPHGPARTPR